MEIEDTHTVESTTKATLDVKITYSPSNQTEERITSLLATMIDILHQHTKLLDFVNEMDSPELKNDTTPSR